MANTIRVFSIALLVIVINLCFRSAAAYGGGWTNAHATFYGGGDASGTMGKFTLLAKHVHNVYHMAYQNC